MEDRAEIVARGLRVFARAAIAGAALALAGEVSLAAPSSQPIAAPFASPVAAPARAAGCAGRRQAGRAARRLRRDAGRLLRLARGLQAGSRDRRPAAGGDQLGAEQRRLRSRRHRPRPAPGFVRAGLRQIRRQAGHAPIACARGGRCSIAYAEPLEKIEQRFGVPGPVLVAIWGLETEFGAGLGNYPTFNALATLAYDCRRADQFREELVDALKLVARGDMQPEEMRGAWAGEIGQTQFMPSTYLKYATSADGGARRRPGRQFRGRARFDRQFPQEQGLEARPGLPRRRAQFRRAARMERRAGLRQDDRLLRRPAGRVRRAVSRLCDSQGARTAAN